MSNKTITNNSLYILGEAINKLYNDKFQSRISNKIKKVREEIKNELKTVDETRIEIFKKFGELNEKNTFYNIKEEHKEEANKELKELFEDTVEFNNHDLKVSNFGDKLSPAEIEILELGFENDLDLEEVKK